MSTAYKLGKEICKTLFHAGYVAYFAGGWVRDFLLGKTSGDEIDIATSAPPKIIQQLFPKTIPVGIAFGVVIVVLEGIHFEVTTFRKDHPYHDGRHPDGVDFSSPEKDAQRRDFTINGMFYDPLTESLYDYVEGQKDLEKKLIRAIGDPFSRFTEDRLRMIRAVRFSARLGFQIEAQTASAIASLSHTLFPAISMERVWQELSKMAAYPHFEKAIVELHQLQLLNAIFPQLPPLTEEEVKKRVAPFIYFPLNTPCIVFIMELFSTLSLEEKLNICRYLKTPLSDRELVAFFHQASEITECSNATRYEWAHLYAHPHAQLFIEIEGSKIEPPRRIEYLKKHDRNKGALSKHILRIQQKNPLVRAHHLQAIGIKPGKEMGMLLKQAERLAIDHDLDSTEAVLQLLKSFM